MRRLRAVQFHRRQPRDLPAAALGRVTLAEAPRDLSRTALGRHVSPASPEVHRPIEADAWTISLSSRARLLAREGRVASKPSRQRQARSQPARRRMETIRHGADRKRPLVRSRSEPGLSVTSARMAAKVRHDHHASNHARFFVRSSPTSLPSAPRPRAATS
jgi:hypothetical protein